MMFDFIGGIAKKAVLNVYLAMHKIGFSGDTAGMVAELCGHIVWIAIIVYLIWRGEKIIKWLAGRSESKNDC